MSDGSKIEWTDATWNPVTGCSIVSPGCTNCYAMRLAGTRLRHHPSRAGLTDDSRAGPIWNGEVRFNEQWLDQPLRWKKPRRIFVCAHGDLFHPSVPDAWIDKVAAVMALSPQHTFQVLTKRSDRMWAHFSDEWVWPRIEVAARRIFRDLVGKQIPGRVLIGPLPNVWLGVSVEDQARADERLPDLLATPAAVRWISAEPLLGWLDLRRWIGVHHHPDNDPSNPAVQAVVRAARTALGPTIDWVVAGGESGPGGRPMHPDWIRSLRDQCAAAGVPFFFKQFGEWLPEAPALRSCWEGVHQIHDWPDSECISIRVGKKAAGATLDGREHREWPA